MGTSSNRFVRTWRLLVAVALLALGLVAVSVAQAADPLIVADGDVYGDQGLVWAIQQANSTPGETVIELAENGTYTLTAVDNTTYGPNGLPVITETVIIEGNGATIQRDASAEERFRIFAVESTGTLALNDLTISGGFSDGSGGGIFNNRFGRLNLTDSTVNDNRGAHGGGIFNYYHGALEVTNSTVSDNSAVYSGGGIFNSYSAALEVTNSTVSGNSALYYGGGIHNEGSALLVINSTVSGNSAYLGGGIFNYYYGALEVTNSTVSDNSAYHGGGIYNYIGTATLTNTLVGANSASTGPDVYGVITDGGHNLLSIDADSTGLIDGDNGNLVGTAEDPIDSMLELDEEGKPYLKNNGGTTETIALLAASPAIDAGNDEKAPVTDQRGVSRPQGAASDIGAFELEQDEPPSDPEEQLENLIDDLADMEIDQGTEKSLGSTLDNAQAALERGNLHAASGQLGAFINQVEAQRGKGLTDEQADQLVQAAQAILVALEP
jgi:hypothetical protein